MIRIYFDGGCKPNPGMMEVAIVAPALGASIHHRLEHGTSNQAEWLAALMAMEFAYERGFDEIELFGDSTLIVNQAEGVWKCKDPTMKVFLDEFRALRTKFKFVRLEYVRRRDNLAGHYIEEMNA